MQHYNPKALGCALKLVARPADVAALLARELADSARRSVMDALVGDDVAIVTWREPW